MPTKHRRNIHRIDSAASHPLFSKQEWCLLQLAEGHGVPVSAVAGAVGQPVRSVRRRIAKLRRRMADPVFLALGRYWRAFSPEERRLLYLHVALGLSQRKIADQRLLVVRHRDGLVRPAGRKQIRLILRAIEWKVRRDLPDVTLRGRPPGRGR